MSAIANHRRPRSFYEADARERIARASGCIPGWVVASVGRVPLAKVVARQEAVDQHVPSPRRYSAISSFCPYSAQPRGVAWWAHVGGFLAGLVLIRWLGTPSKKRRR